ncbi:hypothetical protein ASPZODRAFT_153358 [Penicilliopsis zonata CBS 506.65]|uniref:ABC transporter domain-containing protein n=1 Tax=Penicilliopsis zonata CBS 506.65 TaxID=1073090 RepID=A0A1L9SD40_9EURO|nr:hypothetical protein ASPZODRAFT_153358 [Penicilliopsis zonata CBS 506.65]OJJ45058.1 hypothetical protein ASPZODRAFT_153358 [Penicilliopsis zonata CBS 506.65]
MVIGHMIISHGFPRRGLTTAPPLISIKSGTFYQQYPTAQDSTDPLRNPPLFPNLSFTLPSKPDATSKTPSLQHWAVIGPPTKTQLLEVLRGQLVCVPPTARSYPYLLTDEVAARDSRLRYVGRAIQYIGFSGEGSEATGGTRGAYLSARYESFREETDWTVQQYLRGQTSLNPLEGEEGGTVKDEALFEQIVTDLRLAPLLDMPVANLSNGQTRRARIAKALLSQPELLLLDDPFMGLDPAAVKSISGLLHRLADNCAPRLVLALRPQDAVPDWITHVMVLGHMNRVLVQGQRGEVDQTLDVWKHLVAEDEPSLKENERDIYTQAKAALEEGVLDRQLLRDLNLVSERNFNHAKSATQHGEPIIEMDGVRVQYGDKAVLGDWTQTVGGVEKDGFHWRVRRGQRWAILGANGSGKTTLLSLITSDHPQTYSLPVKVFGRSRLPEPGKPGISIFELQSRLGHSSPEIHAFFPRQLTVRQAIESAFAETFLARPTLDHDRDLDVNAALRFFKADLDPKWVAGGRVHEEPPTVEKELSSVFPTLEAFNASSNESSSNGKTKTQKKHFIDTDYDIEYADSVLFGELSTAQQRVVLFLRALIHRPDIVILDEPFSGLSASVRDKCLHFLDNGELPGPRGRPRGLSEDPLLSRKKDPSEIRFRGLSADQALVMISHLREDIPDSVRHFVRLPADQADGSEPLDFVLGVLRNGRRLNADSWAMAWQPGKTMRKPTKAPKVHLKKEPGSDHDVYNYIEI